MFTGTMVTPAIPERVYTLCKMVEKKPISNAELKEKMEPAFLENNTEYFSDYRKAAEELGLISVSDNLISLAVRPETVASIEDMRFYINGRLEKFQDGQFYRITKTYFAMESDVLKGEKNVANMASVMEQKAGIKVDSMAMRAWRFWVSFLGFGYLQGMYVIPNADVFLKDIILRAGFETGKNYSMNIFIERLRPYGNIIIDPTPTVKYLNFGVSNGLRTLHDQGFLELEHVLDQADIWTLYPMYEHERKRIITNVTVLY